MLKSLFLDVFRNIFPIIDKAIVDKDQVRKLKHDIEIAILEMDQKQLEARANVIMAEASGESWLQRSWRPITMLSFLGLLYTYWLGLAPEQIYASNELMENLFELLQIGIGGYIGSRGIEKTVKVWKEPEKVRAAKDGKD